MNTVEAREIVERSSRLEMKSTGALDEPSLALPVQRPYAILAREVTVCGMLHDRDDRIELRASRERKARARSCRGVREQPGSHQLRMRAALPAAEAIVARHERISLSARDSARVLRLLEHPPKPTAALRAAAKRRRNRM